MVLTLSDYNYVKNGDKCEPIGPEPVPPGVCAGEDPDKTYMGSSGYRKIPGNTCVGGVDKDKQVEKKCAMGGFFTSLLSSLSFL